MKIGLIAYHSACNYGAVLQLFSTYCYFQRIGHDPIVINWIPADLEDYYRKRTAPSQYTFSQQLRNSLWKETELCRDSSDVARIIIQEKIDKIVVGSDAVCQHHPLLERIKFPTKRIFSIEKMTSDRLYPNVFWGTFNDYLDKPIQWAMISASSQNSHFSFISSGLRKKMYESLLGAKYISVRDDWTKNMLYSISNSKLNVEITPDPVFSFNQNAEPYLLSKQEILKKYEIPDNYILVSFKYWSVSQKWFEELEKIAKSHGLCVVKVPFSDQESVGNLQYNLKYPISPLDWYCLIKYSNGYIGHNMHPIVVCLHNGVPFFSYDNYGIKRFRGRIVNDKSSKIYHILTSAGFMDNRVSCIKSPFVSPSAVEVMDKLINFDKKKARDFSLLYQNRYNKMMLDMTLKMGIK